MPSDENSGVCMCVRTCRVDDWTLSLALFDLLCSRQLGACLPSLWLHHRLATSQKHRARSHSNERFTFFDSISRNSVVSIEFLHMHRFSPKMKPQRSIVGPAGLGGSIAPAPANAPLPRARFTRALSVHLIKRGQCFN